MCCHCVIVVKIILFYKVYNNYDSNEWACTINDHPARVWCGEGEQVAGGNVNLSVKLGLEVPCQSLVLRDLRGFTATGVVKATVMGMVVRCEHDDCVVIILKWTRDNKKK